MRLESNFVQVENNPTVINKVNNVAAAWGWTVQSIQVTDTAVAYESGAVGWTTEFGTFVNKTISVDRRTYASITYQRDMDDAKYKDWVALEKEYNNMEAKSWLTEEEKIAISDAERALRSKWKKTIWTFMLIGVALFALALFIFSQNMGMGEVLHIVSLIPGFACFVGAVTFSELIKHNDFTTSRFEKDATIMSIRHRGEKRKNDAKQAILERARAL